MIIGNLQFVVSMAFTLDGEEFYIMESARCLQTDMVYSKERANKFYREMKFS